MPAAWIEVNSGWASLCALRLSGVLNKTSDLSPSRDMPFGRLDPSTPPATLGRPAEVQIKVSLSPTHT